MKRAGTIWNLFKREIGIISKDRNLTSILLLAPLFYAILYGSMYINKTEKDVPIVIVDLDHSAMSQKLIRMIDAHQLVNVSKIVGDFNYAKEEIIDGHTQAIVYLPNHFEAELKNGKGADLKIYLNTTRFLNSNDINKSINEVVATLGAGVRLKYFRAQGFSYDQSKEMVEPLRLDMRPLFNFTESYGDFMIPAILILILHQTLLIGLSESVAKEREMNTIHELYETSGRSIFSALIGKGMFYTILYSAYALFFFGPLFYFFRINSVGSAIALAIATFIMIISVVMMSIFISSFFDRKIIALQYLTLSSYPVFLISGYSWPAYAMPDALKLFAWLIPFTPYSNMMVRITQMGADFNSIIPMLIHLTILGILYYLAAHYRMNRLFKKQVTKT